MTLHDSNSAPGHPISAATPPRALAPSIHARRRPIPPAICASPAAQAPARLRRFTRVALTDARSILSAAFARICGIINEAGVELARLNRAGLRDDALAGKSRRERARAVADALNRRHEGHRRCC